MAKLYFRYGAMNSGKSTALLQAAHNYEERGQRVVLAKPGVDTKGDRTIVSRLGVDREVDLIIGPATDVVNLIDNEAAVIQKATGASIACLLVDESQFLSPRQVDDLFIIAIRRNIPVLAYGLRTDFRGELFEGSQYLLAWADNLIELKTICHSGKKANMVVRVDENGRAVTEGPQVEVGGNERYVSVSRPEFKKIMAGESAIELQQSVLPLDQDD